MEGADRIFTSEIGKHVEIKTYHSFAWEVLSSHGYLISSQRRLRIVSAQDAAVLSAGLTKDEWLAKQSRLFIEDGLVTYDCVFHVIPVTDSTASRSAIPYDTGH